MIEIEALKEAIETVLFSAYLEDEKALSLMVVAKAESGKTMAMKGYRFNQGVCYLTDCTAYGISRDILPKIASGEVKHIFIADLITPMSKQTKTRKSFIAFLNNLIEEGVAKMTTYMTIWDKEVNAGVIAAITDNELFDGRHEWAKMGFLSRFIIYYYEYNIEQIYRIFEYLNSDDALKPPEYRIELPEEQIKVSINREMLKELTPLAMRIGDRMQLYGFRSKVNFRTFLKAHALRAGRTKVEQEDFDALLKLSEYMDITKAFGQFKTTRWGTTVRRE